LVSSNIAERLIDKDILLSQTGPSDYMWQQVFSTPAFIEKLY